MMIPAERPTATARQPRMTKMGERRKLSSDSGVGESTSDGLAPLFVASLSGTTVLGSVGVPDMRGGSWGL
jgi:hypothetical protein